MDYVGFNWNVIIKGAWNRAILTPNWIANKLYGLEKGTPLEIYVPVANLAPSRVKHERLIVVAADGFLEIIADEPKFATLSRAMEVGVKALNELPVTPVIAAGFNVRYRFDEPIPEIAVVFNTPLDHSLAKADYSFIHRKTIRGCTSKEPVFGKGIINLSVSTDKNRVQQVEFNFHCDSSEKEKLIDWLSIPHPKIESEVKRLLDILSITDLEEKHNA